MGALRKVCTLCLAALALPVCADVPPRASDAAAAQGAEELHAGGTDAAKDISFASLAAAMDVPGAQPGMPSVLGARAAPAMTLPFSRFVGASGEAGREIEGASLAATIGQALRSSPISGLALHRFQASTMLSGEQLLFTAAMGGYIPRAATLVLGMLVSAVFLVMVWSVTCEGKDHSDPFSVGRPALARAEQARGSRRKCGGSGASRRAASSQSLPTQPTAATAGTSSVSLGPPPSICPNLILPQGQAYFRVPLEGLQNVDRVPAPIFWGANSLPVLYAATPLLVSGDRSEDGRRSFDHQQPMSSGMAGRWLQLTTTAGSSVPHASVGPLSFGTPTWPPMEIRGPGGDSYGTLRLRTTGWAAFCGEQLVLQLDCRGGLPHLSGLTAAGDSVASAILETCETGRGVDSAEAWIINASEGADAILLLLCTLAIVLTTPKLAPAGR